MSAVFDPVLAADSAISITTSCPAVHEPECESVVVVFVVPGPHHHHLQPLLIQDQKYVYVE